MMEDRIKTALMKLFDRHRIVFWFDVKKELRADFELLSIPEIEKLEVINNEYALKYTILREQANQKFLLYREGPQLPALENWLLDVQLAHCEFRTDQVAIWLSELELGFEFADVIQDHVEFFQSKKRIESLKKLLKGDDTRSAIRIKMLAVCLFCEARMDEVLENLLQELAEGKSEKINTLTRCNLENFLWERVANSYGYTANEPNVRDFALELFKSCYAIGTSANSKLNTDALVFLKRWKDSRQFEPSFDILSAEYADILSIEQDLQHRDFRTLLDLDLFRLIDQKIIFDLVEAVAGRTISSSDVTSWIRQRKKTHWYQNFKHPYDAIDYAAQFIQALAETQLNMESLADGISRYANSWYRLDQLYRKFTYHVRKSGMTSLMSVLSDQIENLYSNNFLLKLNDRFQQFVDETEKWEALPIALQKHFFQLWVSPFLRKDNKVCVIISDAMRFEVGEELLGLIKQEDRYTADLDPALAMLPSYTQLGMAALLPNKELALCDNDTGAVLVDGQSSLGTMNRSKILSQAIAQRATAIKAEELMSLKGDDCRSLIRDNDVVYIYHNRIDQTGDKLESEERVFEAVEDTLVDLVRLIKKLAGANVNNFLVTADHGFIYQNNSIDESDFSGSDADGDVILYRNRRFVLGTGLRPASGLRHFSSPSLGLIGNVEALIPKSINRLRRKGAGSRFVHGGASLQEIVIPVLKINKKRQSDTSAVEIDILRGSNSTITSGQLAAVFYQVQPASEKVKGRELRAGIYTETGELISNSHDLIFDMTSDNPRDRETQTRFVLTKKADSFNGQTVILKLEEKHPGTSHYREYKSLQYQMRRSFTSDFEF